MGTKTPLIQEKSYSYEGIFDLKGTYSFIKNYLEQTKHYDVSEKEADEKSSSSKQEIVTKLAAEIEYNDYYKITLTLELKLTGKPIVVEDSSGKTHSLVDGKASIIVNGYLEKDYMNKRPVGPLKEFLDKIYAKYLDKDEYGRMVGATAQEVGQLLARFKQQVNSAIK